jgi:hypothetical protein
MSPPPESFENSDGSYHPLTDNVDSKKTDRLIDERQPKHVAPACYSALAGLSRQTAGAFAAVPPLIEF